MDPSTKAAANRAIRTILNELEFLSDTELVSVEQYATIKSLLPTPSAGPGTAPTKSTVDPTLKSGGDVTSNLASLSLAPSNNDRPASRASNVSTAATLNSTFQQRQDGPSPAPSGRARPPPPPATLATASALYAYAPTDPGDLAIAPGDQLAVTEFMNADWAKGRNERTGQEGIFPRSYVRVNEDKPQNFGQQQQQYGYYNEKQQPQMQQQQGYYPNNGQGTPYGNMPVQVAQGQPQEQVQTPPPGKHATASGLGMKFGRKLGNAAIFGAGATLGSDLVNSII